MTRSILTLLLVLGLADQSLALSPRDAVLAALQDLDGQNNQDQPYLRYLYLPAEVEALATFPLALRLHVNLISREAQLAYPRLIAEGLWRVDLRDYQWSPKVWEKLADIDPYFHRRDVREEEAVVRVEDVPWPGGTHSNGYYYAAGAFVWKKRDVIEKVRKVRSLAFVPLGAGQMASLVGLSHSQAPIVRADWFLVQGARQISLNNKATGVGYYDWLGIGNRQDYFDLVGANDERASRIENEIRAVVGESGVTQNNRQVVRQGAINGGHWFTLEIEDQSGRGIAIRNLRKGEFQAIAEEHYAPLANGLPATFLSDAKGVRQDSVPDKIAHNDAELNTSRDKRVHVNIACLQCHAGQVLQPIGDDVRPVYTGRLGVVTGDKQVSLEIRRQYGANLDRVLQKDRSDYQDVFTTVTGKNPKDSVSTYSAAFSKYAYGRISLAVAARELGVTPDQFSKALKDAAARQGKGDFRLDPFLIPEQARTIPRLTWEDAFQDAQDFLFGVLKE